jgi:hypothetical protein
VRQAAEALDSAGRDPTMAPCSFPAIANFPLRLHPKCKMRKLMFVRTAVEPAEAERIRHPIHGPSYTIPPSTGSSSIAFVSHGKYLAASVIASAGAGP